MIATYAHMAEDRYLLGVVMSRAEPSAEPPLQVPDQRRVPDVPAAPDPGERHWEQMQIAFQEIKRSYDLMQDTFQEIDRSYSLRQRVAEQRQKLYRVYLLD